MENQHILANNQNILLKFLFLYLILYDKLYFDLIFANITNGNFLSRNSIILKVILNILKIYFEYFYYIIFWLIEKHRIIINIFIVIYPNYLYIYKTFGNFDKFINYYFEIILLIWNYFEY